MMHIKIIFSLNKEKIDTIYFSIFWPITEQPFVNFNVCII